MASNSVGHKGLTNRSAMHELSNMIEERTGQRLNQRTAKQFFDAISEYDKMRPSKTRTNRDSDSAFIAISRELAKGRSVESVLADIKNLTEEVYQEQEQRNNDFTTGVSDFFT